jgi:DNA helicase II / ATP-dependent DNA helicase PcrA
MRKELKPTEADEQIRASLDGCRNFAVVAGAGSGKTTSLVEALKYVRENRGSELLQNSQQIVCITYTKRAVAVISERLGFDHLFHVSTIHSFLWGVVGRFQKDIRETLRAKLIPDLIARTAEKDNGGKSKAALKARVKVGELNDQLAHLDNVADFRYDDGSTYSDFSTGQIGHGDMIDLATCLILEKPLLRRVLGARFPYILVDEAQDTFDGIVTALNSICSEDGLPLIGYFGDPMQRIYGNGTGKFSQVEGIVQITKKENFRSAKQIINLLNVFRKDMQQFPAGKNANIEGSVSMMLIQSEDPKGSRGQYTMDQLDRSLERFDQALTKWGWDNNTDAKRLFLVRQMIARRLDFLNLHALFTGIYASTKAQNEYEDGKHFLLKPFVSTLCPLIEAQKNVDQRKMIEVLGQSSPAFEPTGINSQKTLKEMLRTASSAITKLKSLWEEKTVRDVLLFAREQGLCKLSPQLITHLEREPRSEEFDKDMYALEKADWLSDAFFKMSTNELIRYSDFVQDNTPFSTQHGSKGEEYDDVLAVFDDTEAAWSQYSFAKLLTPATSGETTDGQHERSRKLAYVCFSRAMVNLRILLFTANPESARSELVSSGLFKYDQVDIL